MLLRLPLPGRVVIAILASFVLGLHATPARAADPVDPTKAYAVPDALKPWEGLFRVSGGSGQRMRVSGVSSRV